MSETIVGSVSTRGMLLPPGDRYRSAVWTAVRQSGFIVQRAAKENVRANFNQPVFGSMTKPERRKEMRKANRVAKKMGKPEPYKDKNFNAMRRTVGGLGKSIIIKEQKASLAVRVGPSAIYGRIRELGGTIYPRSKPRLAWIDPDTGEWVRLRKGQSVTQQGKPYLRPALESNAQQIRARIAESIKQAWKEHAIANATR